MESSTRKKRLYVVFGCLLALLMLTVGVSFLLSGVVGFCVAMAIAVVKMVLIATVFMELAAAKSAVRLAALGGLLWLTILLVCVMADYRSRGWGETLPHSLKEAEQVSAYDQVETKEADE